MVLVYFAVDDPRDNPRKKDLLDFFEPTEYMKLAEAEGVKFGLHYQVHPTDEQEMAFNYQKAINPKSYILRIERVFRVWHPGLKKEFLYYYASKQVQSPPPSEVMPGIEHKHQGFYGFHPKPLIKPEGYDYRGRPVNVRVESTVWEFDIPWDPETLKEIINHADNKFSNLAMFVGETPMDTSRQAPNKKWQVKSMEDFMTGNIFDLIEMGQSRTEFTNLKEFQETKEAQKKHKADLVNKKNIANRPVTS